jgi:cytochrome c-type biogenesis protein CcmF
LSLLGDLANKTANKSSRAKALKALPLSYYGMQIAHLGAAVMLIGIGLTSAFSYEKSVLLSPGQSIDLGNYVFMFNGSTAVTGPNYVGNEADISVSKNDRPIGNLKPQRRLYLASGTPSTEMAIDAGFFRDLFVTLGEEKESGAWSMTIYVKPFIRWIWLGAIFMAFGGVIAAGDKRYRRLRKRELERAATELSGELQTAS